MIESSYGWRDAEVMALPLCRARQAAELIGQRMEIEARVKAKMIEWHAKVMGTVISSTAELTNAGRRQISKMIDELKLFPDDEDLDEKLPPTEDEMATIIREGSQTAINDPRNAAAQAWLEKALG